MTTPPRGDLTGGLILLWLTHINHSECIICTISLLIPILKVAFGSLRVTLWSELGVPALKLFVAPGRLGHGHLAEDNSDELDDT